MDAAAIMRRIIQDPTQLRDDLAIWMQQCRWAGLSGLQYPKDYAVTIDLCQDFLVEGQPEPFLLLGITVTMQNAQDSRHFCLIFALTKLEIVPDGTPTYPISTIFTPAISQNQWILRFATLDPTFVTSLLRIKNPTIIAKGEDFTLKYTSTNKNPSPPLGIQEFKVLGGGDTTNSIVRVTLITPVGLQRFVFKSYLRLLEHNIEAEMISHLHAVGFSAVPKLEGNLVLKWRRNYTLLLLSRFVENEGDGGKPFWDHLQEYLRITQTQKYVKSELQKIGSLSVLVGQTTREFHEALVTLVLPTEAVISTKSKMRDVRQWETKIHHINAWERELKKNLVNAVKLWSQRQSLLFPHLFPEILVDITNDLSRIVTQIKIEAWVNPSLVPVMQPIHGDLHLGQFLFQSGPPPRFFVTDLEGDPQLPPKRRREPRTVWFDLGGLLRALDYIAFFGTWESLKQQVQSHLWIAEDIFALFLVRLAGIPVPPVLEQYRWVAESTVAHALEWAEFIGTQILRGYGVKEKLEDELPVAFKLVRATSELNYELSFRGQNALVPLLGVLTIGNQWLKLKKGQ